jgi:hypothetical protein
MTILIAEFFLKSVLLVITNKKIIIHGEMTILSTIKVLKSLLQVITNKKL